MFIEKWQVVFWYIGRMDWGAGHLTIIIGTGVGHLPTKISRRAGHLSNFFKCPCFCPGRYSRLELTRTLEVVTKTSVFTLRKLWVVSLFGVYAGVFGEYWQYMV